MPLWAQHYELSIDVGGWTNGAGLFLLLGMAIVDLKAAFIGIRVKMHSKRGVKV